MPLIASVLSFPLASSAFALFDSACPHALPSLIIALLVATLVDSFSSDPLAASFLDVVAFSEASSNALSFSSPLAYFFLFFSVLCCLGCVEKLVKKDMKCAHCSAILLPHDIVALEMGGTGFVAHGHQTSASTYTPAFQC